MPPRFAYWTILVGGLPTAFRAAERGEIEPTFRRLRDKHPDAELRWFARGKLWASPAEASEALERQKAAAQRPRFGDRDRNWRPGGAHRDPRQPYKDAKKRENQKRRERRFEFKKGPGPQAPGSRPAGGQAKWSQRPYQPRPKPGDRGPESRGQGPQAGGRRPNDQHKRWDRPGPKSWQEREKRAARGEGGQAERKPWQGERPQWKRPADEPPDGTKPAWKSRAKPGAWSPKPGARNRPPRKGPRGQK